MTEAAFVRVYFTDEMYPSNYLCPECRSAPMAFCGSAGGEGFGVSLEYECERYCEAS